MTTLQLLLAQLDQAYNRRSWHGTNLRGSIRGLTATQAAWRPASTRHSIQEVVVHAAYWKYVVRRRLTRAARGSFPLKGSNWFPRPRANEEQWRADTELLEEMHRLLRSAVADLDPDRLERAEGKGVTAGWLVSGIIAHDLYHAGQIQLLKKLKAS
jgi:uncharacterized damage-inducible protein DinB